MARKITVQLTDDLDGTTDDTVAGIQFGLDGHQYEIDLCKKNADKLRSLLEPYIHNGRKAASRPERRARKVGGETTSDGIRLSEIRAWAQSNGHTVSDRGRIAAHIIDAYRSK
jgi:hypothetical protein